MGPYHAIMVHFPVALWTVASGIVFFRRVLGRTAGPGIRPCAGAVAVDWRGHRSGLLHARPARLVTRHPAGHATRPQSHDCGQLVAELLGRGPVLALAGRRGGLGGPGQSPDHGGPGCPRREPAGRHRHARRPPARRARIPERTDACVRLGRVPHVLHADLGAAGAGRGDRGDAGAGDRHDAGACSASQRREAGQ